MPLLLRQDSGQRGAMGDRESGELHGGEGTTGFAHGNHRHDHQATDVLTCYFQTIFNNIGEREENACVCTCRY